MPLLKRLRLIFTFYRSFLLASVLITGCCLVLFWEYGMSIFNVLVWLKFITMGIIGWFINNYKSKEYYYYQNAGIAKGILWVVTLVFDFSLFLFLMVQLYKSK